MASLKSRCSYGCCYHVSALLGRWLTKATGFIQAWHTCFIIYRRKCSNDITFSWSSVTDSILHDQICNTVNNHLEQFLNIHHKLVYVVMMITKLRHCPKKTTRTTPIQKPYEPVRRLCKNITAPVRSPYARHLSFHIHTCTDPCQDMFIFLEAFSEPPWGDCHVHFGLPGAGGLIFKCVCPHIAHCVCGWSKNLYMCKGPAAL